MEPSHKCIISTRRDVDAEGFFLFGIILTIGVLFVTFYFGLPALKSKIQPVHKPTVVTSGVSSAR